MGGGDLNLKKSWHPSTLRNIERVWKAEQKHEVEKQKIEQLQKELAEERAREEIQAYAEDQGVVKKKEERLDWMYQGPAAMVNREDYLLGRKIDKTLELLEQQESGTKPKSDDLDITGSSMFSSQDLSGTAPVDLANKIREDPLFSIMKKEKEQRKNLLSNPVKMKQLQQMLQESLGKRKKKSKKRHSNSDADSKYHKKHKKNKSRKSSLSSGEDCEVDTKKHQNYPTRNKSEERHRRKSSTTSSYQNKYHPREREYRNPLPKYGNSHSKHTYSRSDINSKDKNSQSGNKKKLNDEEREQRLKEMQENAKWREEQRAKKVRRYKEEDEREEKSSRVDASDFIKPMLSKAAGEGSLENRVKQKIFSIQRNSANMDRHFARR